MTHVLDRSRPLTSGRAAPARRAMLRRLVTALAIAASAGTSAPCLADGIVVIVNRDNPNPVDREFVVRVYTGAIRGWPDGSPVFALDQPEDSETRQQFATMVLGKSVANLRAIWSQNIFTGRGMPPKVTTPDSEMKHLVATNRNAIGYIRASQLDATVRAITR
ncbi:MAG: substrate-binding domain-containing protein [Burkholderiaceae bacterium]|nr:substrate-binding domain-containing protein [Burkholderiaceae bacterium]